MTTLQKSFVAAAVVLAGCTHAAHVSPPGAPMTWPALDADFLAANTATYGFRLGIPKVVGFAPDGFDAWEWQDLLAPGCRIGAPPDLLGPDGQDWGLPPFVPWRVRSLAYRPIAETLRANLRHGEIGRAHV